MIQFTPILCAIWSKSLRLQDGSNELLDYTEVAKLKHVTLFCMHKQLFTVATIYLIDLVRDDLLEWLSVVGTDHWRG